LMAHPSDGTRDGMHSNRFRKAGERCRVKGVGYKV